MRQGLDVVGTGKYRARRHQGGWLCHVCRTDDEVRGRQRYGRQSHKDANRTSRASYTFKAKAPRVKGHKREKRKKLPLFLGKREKAKETSQEKGRGSATLRDS